MEVKKIAGEKDGECEGREGREDEDRKRIEERKEFRVE